MSRSAEVGSGTQPLLPFFKRKPRCTRGFSMQLPYLFPHPVPSPRGKPWSHHPISNPHLSFIRPIDRSVRTCDALVDAFLLLASCVCVCVWIDAWWICPRFFSWPFFRSFLAISLGVQCSFSFAANGELYVELRLRLVATGKRTATAAARRLWLWWVVARSFACKFVGFDLLFLPLHIQIWLYAQQLSCFSSWITCASA